MSLAEITFRNLTVLALLDKTLAESNVQSSLLVPLNELGKDEVAPVIAVFTDAMRAEDVQIDGNDLLAAQGTVTLALEIGCVGKAPSTDGKGIETWLPNTDEGMEMTIDVIRRQALVELQSGTSIWASLWRDCRIKTRGIVVERGSAIERGVRLAAKRTELRVELVADPVPGQALPKFWADCLAAFDADERTSDLAKTLRLLASGEEMPIWRSWQADLGLTDAGVRGLGIVPSDDAGPDDQLTLFVSPGAGQADIAIAVNADEATVTVGDGDAVVVVEAADG